MRRVLLLASLTVGCGAANPSATALPAREDVAIQVPGATTNVRREAAHIGSQAVFYTLTRQISEWVNSLGAMFFDVVDQARATPPSAQDATNAYWGPFTDALSPMTAVLAVQRVDDQNYNFFLGGKPKGAPDSAFAGLFGGKEH